MVLVLAFGVVLLVTVALSGPAARSVPSTALSSSWAARWSVRGSWGSSPARRPGAVHRPVRRRRTASATDPVFASAIVSRSEVPARLRTLFGVESGVNDGLALPFVLVLLALGTGTDAAPGAIAVELVLGVVIGVVLPLVVIALLRLPALGAEPRLQPLGPVRPQGFRRTSPGCPTTDVAGATS
ncbi:cation:proton antiporter domain-containing protein [Pseudonocardia saturnea]